MRYKSFLLLCALAFVLTACGGSDDPPTVIEPLPIISTTPSTGIFVDSPVSGLYYETPSRSGITNSAGEYGYLAGERVVFSIGGIILGEALAAPIVTPLTIVEGATDASNPVVINIVRLLLTLDEDANPDNGIAISAATATAAIGLSVDFAAADLSVDAGVSNLLVAISAPTSLVDEVTAQAHFTETLASSWGSMTWGSGTWVAASAAP